MVFGCRTFGERWRRYRSTAEFLKGEGWRFFQLSCPSYDRYRSHAEAYRTIAARVEDIGRLEVEVYLTSVAQEEQDKGKENPEDAASKV